MDFARLLIALAALCFAANSYAIDDTPQNRAAQAERAIAATPPEEMMQEMAASISMNLPPSDRPEFRRMMTEIVDLEVITNAMRESMIRHFSADELAAIADLYESPVGKSAMTKMGPYMADVMPTIEAEILRAFGELQKIKAEENRQLPDAEEKASL